MKNFLFLSLKFFIFLLLCFMLTGLQSSFWPPLLGFLPAPQLWITVLNYWVMNKSPLQTTLFIYLVVYVLLSMSGIPLVLLYALTLSLFGILYFIRERLIGSGPTQFMLACGGSAFLTPFLIYIFTILFDLEPIWTTSLFNVTLSSLITALFALPVYSICLFIDKITDRETRPETLYE